MSILLLLFAVLKEYLSAFSATLDQMLDGLKFMFGQIMHRKKMYSRNIAYSDFYFFPKIYDV